MILACSFGCLSKVSRGGFELTEPCAAGITGITVTPYQFPN